jgi:hypothetical protein
MRTYEFWRECASGSIWAVALLDGVVVGCCGPLTWSEIDERLLPAFDYDVERGAVVEGHRERFELFDSERRRPLSHRRSRPPRSSPRSPDRAGP